MTPEERMHERAAQRRLAREQASVRFTFVGGLLGAGLGAVVDRTAPVWIMALTGAAGGLLGWFLGVWVRRTDARAERRAASERPDVQRSVRAPSDRRS